MTPEAKVKAKVKKILNDMGAYYCMPIGVGYGNSGVPDFIVCYQGKFVGIECKAGKNEPTALQVSNMAKINNSGGHTMVVNERNVEDVRNFLEVLK